MISIFITINYRVHSSKNYLKQKLINYLKQKLESITNSINSIKNYKSLYYMFI